VLYTKTKTKRLKNKMSIVEKIKQSCKTGLQIHDYLETHHDVECVKKCEWIKLEDFLKILSGYTIIEKQKIRELADLLKNRPYKMPHRRGEYGHVVEEWFEVYEEKFVEAFSMEMKDVLKIFSDYTIIEKQKIRELTDFLKNLKNYVNQKCVEAYESEGQDEWANYEIDLLESIITKFDGFEKKFVEVFGAEMKDK